ncbi:PEGA domain-containing protein [bacterium]|nr:PEGA domain-containing protein [FCB group bacterium]MBL7190198.1 PEGA domain-containing protein [bacterium]
MAEYNDQYLEFDPIISDIDIKKRSRLSIIMLIMFRGSIWFFLPMLIVAAVVYYVIVQRKQPTGGLIVLCGSDTAAVLLNGTRILQKTGQLIEGLPLGNVTVTVVKDGFIPEPEHIVAVVLEDDTLTISFSLAPQIEPELKPSLTPVDILRLEREIASLPETPIYNPPVVSRRKPQIEKKKTYGSIIVSCNVKGASIFLNGDSTGKITNNSFDSLKAGRYVISVKKESFRSELDSQVVEINRDYQTELLFFNMNPIYRPVKPMITIKTTPVAGNIYIDGELAGTGSVSREYALGRHIVFFGAMQNYKTPPEREIILTQLEPVKNLTIEYVREIGQAALALVPEKEGQKIDGAAFRLYIDDIHYFGPNDETVDCYLFDDLTKGKHRIRVFFNESETEREIELQDGKVLTLTYLLERVFTSWRFKLKEAGLLERDNWVKKYGALKVKEIASIQ